MKIYLFDTTETHLNLLPLSFTRPIAEFRCGILKIREKWEHRTTSRCEYFPVDYLRDKFGNVDNREEDCLFISGNIFPRKDLCSFIETLKTGDAVLKDSAKEFNENLENILIYKGSLKSLEKKEVNPVECPVEIKKLEYVFDIFLNNPEEIREDYKILTKGRKSQPLPSCVRTLQYDKGETDFPDSIFIEEGAVVECAAINVTKGPVYIGKDSVLMEGACIRGPFALCEEGEVRMGAKIYEGTTIGPHCKVGGEISNTVFFGYSNKSHDGYLGNAVIGEWCNIGAGTNASNLKNDYSRIRVWNYRTKSFMRTDLQFCGLIMGDHSKIGVNCMINTATVMGVGVNVHGSGFPRVYLNNFSEGSAASGFDKVPLKKFIDIMERVMSRRHLKPSAEDIALLTHIYDLGL